MATKGKAKKDYSTTVIGRTSLPVNAESPEATEVVERLKRALSGPASRHRNFYGYAPESDHEPHVSGNSISFIVDRYGRQDHGGGPHGNDWMDEGQIEEQHSTAWKEYGSRVEDAKRILKECSFESEDVVDIDVGEKGHVYINVNLRKRVAKDVMDARAKAYLGDATPKELSLFSESPDKTLRSLVAANPKTPKSILSKMVEKNMGRTIDTSLARNPNTPKSDLSTIFARAEGDISMISAVASNPSIPATILKHLSAVVRGEEKLKGCHSDRDVARLEAVLFSNPSWDEESRERTLKTDPVSLACLLAKTSFGTKAAFMKILSVVDERLAPADSKKKAEAEFWFSSACEGIIKSRVADDELIRAVLRVAGRVAGKGSAVRAAAASENSSPELIDELLSGLAGRYADASTFSAIIANPSASKAAVLKACNELDKLYKGAWRESKEGEIALTRLGADVLAESSAGRAGKKKKTAADELKEFVKTAPVAVVATLLKTRQDLPAEAVSVLVDRYKEAHERACEKHPDTVALALLMKQRNISDEAFAKVSYLYRLADSAPQFWSDTIMKEHEELTNAISTRLEVAEMFQALKAKFGGKAKTRLRWALKNGSSEVLEAILGRKDLPTNVAAWVYKNMADEGFDVKLICTALARNPATPEAILSHMADQGSSDVGGRYNDNPAHEALAQNPSTPASALRALAQGEDRVKLVVAQNKRTPREVLKQLVDSRESSIRRAAAETLGEGGRRDEFDYGQFNRRRW